MNRIATTAVLASLSWAACAGQSVSSGTVRVVVTGLAAGAADGGTLSAASQGTPPPADVSISVPASGTMEAQVPPGTYSISYVPPAGHTMAPGTNATASLSVAAGAVTTVTFAVVAAGSPSGNEPPGMTVITERLFNAPGESPGWGEGGAPLPEDPLSYRTDGTAPRSPPGVAAASFAGGSSMVSYLAEHSLTAGNTGMVYVSLWFRLDPQWLQPPSNRMALVRLTGGDGSVEVKLTAMTAGSVLVPALELEAAGLSELMPLPGITLAPGTWHRWEVLLVFNSGGGVANGTARWWLDNVRAGDYTNVVFLSNNAQPRVWDDLEWQPSWPSSPVPVTQAVTIDHLYVSGK